MDKKATIFATVISKRRLRRLGAQRIKLTGDPPCRRRRERGASALTAGSGRHTEGALMEDKLPPTVALLPD